VFTLETPVFVFCTRQTLMFTSEDHKAHINIIDAKKTLNFLSAFATLRKATSSFVMSLSVHLSIRMEQLGSHWTDLFEILYLVIFRKPVEKIQV
jgi:hypothetical protein